MKKAPPWSAILGSLAFLFFVAGNSGAQVVIDLTGVWYDKESVTYIQQVGTEVWWMQRNLGDGGKEYTNVFHGKLKGNELSGKWSDVPAGKAHSHGTITGDVLVKGQKVTAINVEITFLPSNETGRYRLTQTKPK